MATTTKTVLGNIVTAVANNIAKIKEAIGNASGSDAGLMSSEDKTKLDGMEEGATKTTIANNLTTTETGSALDAAQGKALSDKLASFQAGVDTLYNTGVSLGVTPTAKTPSAIHTAIYDGFQNSVYNKCVSLGTTPSAKTYSSVAEAIDAIASSGSGSSEQAFIIYPSLIIGVMGADLLTDASTVAGTSTNYNSFYFTQTMSKISSIPNGAGVWSPFQTIKLGQKGYKASQESSYPSTLFNNRQAGGNFIYYPSNTSYTEVVMTSTAQKSGTHGGSSIPSSNNSKYPSIIGWYGSLDLLKFNDDKTRIYLLGNTFEFLIGDSNFYNAAAKEITYSVIQIL